MSESSSYKFEELVLSGGAPDNPFGEIEIRRFVADAREIELVRRVTVLNAKFLESRKSSTPIDIAQLCMKSGREVLVTNLFVDVVRELYPGAKGINTADPRTGRMVGMNPDSVRP